MALREPCSNFLSLLSEITDISKPEQRYLEEPRGRYKGQGTALAKPRTVEEVSQIIRLCNENNVGVVPYGGGTGLVGGQLSLEGPDPIILSLERMNRIREVNVSENILITEAGAILADVQNAAEKVDHLFPLSLASEGSCQIGGNLGTNAGGINVLRYGNARELCLGVEAVLPDGTIYNGLKKLKKDNTGYSLRNLLIGSEGTLGVITAAALWMAPKPIDVEAAFVAVTDPDAALELLNHLTSRLGNMVSGYELIHRRGLDFLEEVGMEFQDPLTPRNEWMVLLECGAGANSGLKDRLENLLAHAFDEGWVTDAVLAQNETQRKAFWQIRESIPEANRRIGVVSSHDISFPISRVPEFIKQAAVLVEQLSPDLRINCFGHMGDGNLHYNIYPPEGVNRDKYDDIREELKDIIYDLVHEFDGSFSAEHGVGRMKKGDLLKYGDAGKLAAMRAVKSALDPNGIMNPGAVI